MTSYVWIVAVLAIFGAAGLRQAQRWLEQQRTRRALHAARALDPSLPEGGIVRVTGRVRVATHFFDAPLSNRRCVAYRVRMYRKGGVVSDSEIGFEEGRALPFEIERPDGTRVAIDGEHARLDMPYLPLPPGSEDRCHEFTKSRRIVHGGILTLTFQEVVVMEDMRVSVAGLLMKDASLTPNDSERGFRDDQPPAMRLAGDAKHPVIIGVPVD